ncbi:DNA-binding transcriptional LysR family regulator [Rhodoligotrophos appendicifer]|uniref:LysR family transcriptional regulator n=1 Tax=Rhodoligotrophos appendicifer TaxID=987056 RepID=UPI00147852BF|nr:LysR family transcriptional regulator [Rhodoligotrophos appendicifer]
MDTNLPDLRAFRVFVTVAEMGGIKPAAERLGRSPSAISMALKNFETTLGAPLFEQERKAHLTPFGRVVFDQAREVLQHFLSACATIDTYARNQIGRCDVGSVTSVSMAFLPRAIRLVQQRMPEFGVEVHQLESPRAPNAVLDGVVDIAFVARLSLSDELQFDPLFKDGLDLVCANADPLVQEQEPVTWSMIAKRVFILNDSFNSIEAPEFLDIIRRSTLRVRSISAVLAAVREGLGVSVLPRLCSVHGAEGVTFLPLADGSAHRVVGMLSKRDRRQLPGTAIFAAAVQEVIEERAADLRYEYLGTRSTGSKRPA